jgi:hypothetical protein
MEAGMNEGPAFGGWQHFREGIRHMLFVKLHKVEFVG